MESTTRLHPLLSTAAVSLIALSAAGIGAVTGLFPTSVGPTRITAPVPVAAAAAIAPGPAAAPAPVTASALPAAAAKPRPVRKAALPVAALPPAVKPICLDCGTVEAVRAIEQKGEGSWIGPVAGGVGGAILGKQMGKGKGNTIMTILGAAGGAYAGHEIEKHARSTTRWDVSVRLDDGTVRSVSYDAAPAWRAGERVRYLNGAILPEQST